MKRSLSIDFLRGIAVILVLFSHQWLSDFTYHAGWIGVDMFFVLSGFLVSGLLFKEYLSHGTIECKRFLIRRGFKIYPAFYFSVFLMTAIYIFAPNLEFFPNVHRLELNTNGVIAAFVVECLFLQSYFPGFLPHHWSLGVEEHFYFLLVIFIYLMRKRLENKRLFVSIAVFVFVASLALRIISNWNETALPRNYSATHLRLDSLFAGVLLGYFYHFHFSQLENFYRKYKLWLLACILPLLSFAPVGKVLDSFFAKTFGFTMLWLAFGSLLLVFIFGDGEKIKNVIGETFYKWIAKIGFYSYGIYLFHFYVVKFFTGDGYAEMQYKTGNWAYWQVILLFAVYVFLSVLIGIFISKLIEIPFLKIRDKYFPRAN